MRCDYTLSGRNVLEKLLQFTMDRENALPRSRASAKWKYLLA
jgi:hypothetical protein